MRDWKPPWVDSRYRYVHRSEKQWDVIDIGNPVNPREEFPRFVAACESPEMAAEVCDAMEAHSQREEEQP